MLEGVSQVVRGAYTECRHSQRLHNELKTVTFALLCNRSVVDFQLS